MSKKILPAVLLLCVSLLFWACGYHLEGGGYLRNVRTLGVRVAENNSSETDAEVIFTNALINEIVQKSDTKLRDVSLAPVILELKIKTITLDALARSDQTSVNERKVSAVIDAVMLGREGEEIWAAYGLSLNESYLVSSNGSEEDNRKTALDKIAERTAESLVSRMLSNF